MPKQTLSVLFPDWSTPQWEAIRDLLRARPNAALDLELVAVAPEKVSSRLLSLAQKDKAPDLYMVPTTETLQHPDLRMLADINEISPRLADEGAVVLRDDLTAAVGVTPLWATDWLISSARVDESIISAFGVAGRYRDLRLPVSPVSRTSLLLHDQTFKLPKKLGGLEFSVHPKGSLDIELETNDLNPNLAAIRVFGIQTEIPASMLPFGLDKLPWPGKQTVETHLASFSVSLVASEDPAAVSGNIDFQSGETSLRFRARVDSLLFEKLGRPPLEIEIEESGVWDRLQGTFTVTSGSIRFVEGIFEGLAVLILASSKNQQRTVVTATASAWIAAEVQVLQYGTKPSTAPDIKMLRKILNKLAGTAGARFAKLIAAAVSVTRARSVFVTYVCQKTETLQDQDLKRGKWRNVGAPRTRITYTKAQQVELPDAEAFPWWDATRRSTAEMRRTIARNRPRTGC